MRVQPYLGGDPVWGVTHVSSPGKGIEVPLLRGDWDTQRRNYSPGVYSYQADSGPLLLTTHFPSEGCLTAVPEDFVCRVLPVVETVTDRTGSVN